MFKKLITVKKVSLNNNCPECFSKDGLELTFKQKFIETKLYKSITQEITSLMHCNKCNTRIYPVNWTEDIERVYNYQLKAFEPKKASKKFKPLFWTIVGIITTIIILAIVLLLTYLP